MTWRITGAIWQRFTIWDLGAMPTCRRPGTPRTAELHIGTEPSSSWDAEAGALTKHLVDAGFSVIATDASPAMLELAAQHVPRAEYRLLTLPDDPIPQADAIVAVGHPLNYLDDSEAVTRARHPMRGSSDPRWLLIAIRHL